MRVLVTGGAGFVGSNLVKFLLNKGHNVLAIDSLKFGSRQNLAELEHLNFKFIQKDLREVNLVELLQGIDYVFHLAGISSLVECEANPGEAFDVNTKLVADILNATRYSEVRRFIFSSTSAVYENSNVSTFTESDVVSPDLVYSQSKYFAERIVSAASKNYGIDTVICRFFNVFGPNQDFQRKFPPFTSYIVRELLADRVPILYNSKPVKRNYIYTDDLLEMLHAIMNHDDVIRGEIFNLTSNFSYTPLEIIRILHEVSNTEVKYQLGEPQQFWSSEDRLTTGKYKFDSSRVELEVLKQSIGSTEKFEEVFQFKARIEMKEGLERILRYQSGFSL